MASTIGIALAIGLLLGILVNYLSDILPAFRESSRLEDAEGVARKTSFSRKDGSSTAMPSVYGLVAKIVSKNLSRPASASAVRYPITEIAVMAASGYAATVHGINVQYAVLLFYLTLFVLIAVIDIEHRLVLNIVMFPAFVVALLEVTLNNRITFANGMIGYAAGQIIVMGFYLLGFVYLWVINTNRENPVTEVAFGFGDVTLATFCGLVVGNPDVYFMLFWMVLFGAVSAIGTIIIYSLLRGGRFRAHMAIPYGPSIVLAATVMLLSQTSIPWGLFFLFR